MPNYPEMTKLQVLIATYGEDGLHRVSSHRLPETEGVGYLISCQSPDGRPTVPPGLRRPDVRVVFSRSKGLSVNRNILLREASAPYCLLADDDLDFIPEGLKETIGILDSSPDIDVIAMQYSDREGKTEKRYPPHPFDLRHPPKGYFISCVELAFRRERVVGRRIMFNENFGVNCRYPCGEDDIWLHDALHAGLNGEYRPVKIAIHDGDSTGIRDMGNPSVLRAQGLVISRMNPLSGLPRTILKAWRTSRICGSGFMRCLLPALAGWKDSLTQGKEIFKPQQ